jgi:3-oxoadipate enol-lactonase
MGDATAIDVGEGASLLVRRSGDGPAMVLVGGLGDDHTLFDPLVERLSDRFTCVAFDNRGSGASSPLPDGSGIATLADDAHRLVERLGLGPVIVVGCSMGGAIAQEWALRHPTDVAALVLISTWARPRAHLLAMLDHWVTLHDEGQTRRLVESVSLFCLAPGTWDEDPDLAAALLATESLAEGFALQCEACRGHDTLSRLGELASPTLILAGARDLLMSPDNATELHEGIAGSLLETLATGHVPFWEAPDETAQLIRLFATDHAHG